MQTGTHEERPDADVDALLDRYLGELAEAGTADLEAWAARIQRGRRREEFRREALAHEYVWRQGRGEAVVLEEYAGRLAEEDDRKVFAEIVSASRLAERSLPPQLAPGALLGGRYRIRRPLGRGGMSVVFAAWDQEIGREVAIKVFNAEARAGSPEEWEQIAHGEAAAIARVDHPNVVRVYDIRRDKAQTFLVMDRVPGIDLAQVLDELRRQEGREGADPARRPERLRAIVEAALAEHADAVERPAQDRIDARSWYRTVARVLAPVAAGIGRAHELGQVHRDLKPNNVILRRGADPVVLDFGLSARVRPGSEDSGVLRGTPEYFAPEQARDLRSGSDVRTDVYQLGLVLYEMLTLERAQNREKTEEILRFLARVSLGTEERLAALPKALPRALRAICARALSSKPSERYANAGEMARDLERYLVGLPNEHARTGAAHEAWQRATWLAKKPAFAALVLGGLALGAGAWMRAEAAGREDGLVLTAFHFTPNSGNARPIASSQSAIEITGAHKYEWLGVEVNGTAPVWVYGLGLSRNADGEKVVYPLRPRLLGEHDASSAWALHVPAATPTQVAIYPFDGRDSEEGVLALARDERSEAIERWLASLEGTWSATKRPVPYEEAMASFERIADTRVRGLAGPTSPEADKAAFANLVFERATRQGTSGDRRLKWFQQIVQVKRKD